MTPKEQKQKHKEITEAVERAVKNALDGQYAVIAIDNQSFQFYRAIGSFTVVMNLIDKKRISACKTHDELMADLGISMLTNLFTTLIFKRLSMIRKENKKNGTEKVRSDRLRT